MNFVYIIGKKIILLSNKLAQTFYMISSAIFWLFNGRLEWTEIFKQTVRIGIQSISVTSLTSLFTGMVLALQSGYTSKSLFNEPIYVGSVVGFSLVKELGPVLTAIVVAGRAGASVTAELGTMKVTEQIDALYTLGTNPYSYLVIPRYIAFFIAVPILTVFSDFIGILGGFMVSVVKLKIATTVYWDDILVYMEIKNFMHGFIKSFFFAFTIATVSCYKGLFTEGGAQGVGKSTTESVVSTMVLILAIDYFISAVLVAIGIT
jgi:phospholipid/cholesterol/gamma-HCH transport system permease protein